MKEQCLSSPLPMPLGNTLNGSLDEYRIFSQPKCLFALDADLEMVEPELIEDTSDTDEQMT